MTDPFDDAKDALSSAEPTTDLWAEANRRAASGDVVELTPSDPPSRRGRWLAAAAAVAVLAGTVGVLSMGDDSTVDTTPSDPSDEPTIYQGEDGCSFGITGEPLTPRQFGPAEDPVHGTHFVLGNLMARVNVPAGSDETTRSYRYRPVQLERGEASLRAPDGQSTLVEWSPDGASTCDTFSVSVAGGDSDVTEPAAIALADRIVLQSELPDDDRDPTLFQLGDCAFGVTGDPVVEVSDRDQAPRLGDQPSIRLELGTSQNALVHVPGYVVDDLVGEPVEEVELARGTASVWFAPDFVQVRWFPGTEEPCDSFTVTVAGVRDPDTTTEDGNRHAAVDLAERILLISDLADDPTDPADPVEALEGQWQLESSTIVGEPTDGNGVTFTFLGGEANWTDGCNSFSAPYDVISGTTFSTGDVTSTELPCPTNPTSQAVQQVMGADEIEVNLGSGVDAMFLTAGGTTLTLRSVEGTAGTTQEYGIWPMTAPESIAGYLPEFTGTQEEIAVAFAREVLGWRDAVVTDREPSEDGRFGGVFEVASAATGGVVMIWAGPGDAPSHSTVYRVEAPGRSTDPDATASVQVSGTTGRADVRPKPAGTAESIVRFTWGEYWHEGPAGEAIDLFSHTGDVASTTPGAVLILFRDADGGVIGAWGRTLPVGDFAAG